MLLACEGNAKRFVAERCDAPGFGKLEAFADLLARENERQNLIAQSSVAHIWVRHIADSAQLQDHVSRGTGLWLDLGSGAGFPGLVISILSPEREVVLIESRRLRIDWLNEMIDKLALKNCSVAGQDVQTVPPRAAAVISARAFAPLDRLIRLSARFSTKQTEWVLPKGRSAFQEVAALNSRHANLFHVEQSVTDPDAGIVVGRGQVEIAQ